MRILVTGASGLLGLNLALEAAEEHTVFGLVNHNRLRAEEFTVLQADLLEPGAIERSMDAAQPDWVIHCAALANVDACERDPLLARQLNTEIPAQLAAYVARGGARLVHVSTDAVFDGQRGGYSEQDDPHPLGVYAQTKLDGERAVAEANPQAVIARVNLFGWSLLGRRSLAEFFVNNLWAKNPIQGFTDVFFCPLLANDLGRLFLEMLEKGLDGLYHAVGSECISKYEFGLRIARRFELDERLISPASVTDGGLSAARSPNLTLRTDKLFHSLGHSIPTLSQGIERFYTLYQQGYPQKLKFMRAD